MFDQVRQLFKLHREPWEKALSELEIFADTSIRLLATAPEKVIDTVEHEDLPEAFAQVLFYDVDDTPRVTIDFYNTERGVVIGATFFAAEKPLTGGFNLIEDLETFVSTWAPETARYIDERVRGYAGRIAKALSSKTQSSSHRPDGVPSRTLEEPDQKEES